MTGDGRPVDRGAVLVTGASTGIGEACALHVDRLGYRVFAGVRRTEDGERLQREAPRLLPVILDVTDAALITAAAARVEAETGERGLAGLVNNAGIGVVGPVEFLDLDRYRQQFEVNYFGQIAVTQAMLPALRRGRGRIVNMASVAGRVSLPYFSPYSSSKHALEAMSDSLRMELAPWGMHVAIIEPGVIDTPIWGKGVDTAREVIAAVPEHGAALYADDLAVAIARAEDIGDEGIPPQQVADAVAHALMSPRPKTRYIVGSDARVSILARRFLPDRLVDRLVRRRLGLASKPARR